MGLDTKSALCSQVPVRAWSRPPSLMWISSSVNVSSTLLVCRPRRLLIQLCNICVQFKPFPPPPLSSTICGLF